MNDQEDYKLPRIEDDMIYKALRYFVLFPLMALSGLIAIAGVFHTILGNLFALAMFALALLVGRCLLWLTVWAWGWIKDAAGALAEYNNSKKH